jgi:photosystem I subunit 11
MANFIKAYNSDSSVGHLGTPITSSTATKRFLINLPIYRNGLSPLSRGLEIGMAHGYLLIGPFNSLGPLRNSKVGLLAAFLSAVGLITILTVCLIMYGKVSFKNIYGSGTVSSDLFNLIGWSNFTSGFLIGAYGGAGFAYLLLLSFQAI